MMTIRQSILRGATAVFAVTALALLAPASAHATEPPLAPAWKLNDLEGQEVNSAQFTGKVVVLDFWATWCGPCVSEIPGYIELQKKYGPQGFMIVGVSLDQKGPEHVKRFVQQHAMNYTVVMGDDKIVEAFGGIDAIPTTFLLDRTGHIIDRKVGAVPGAEYESRVQAALK
jgi:thiol-disulfide isomerase/thioredoxin